MTNGRDLRIDFFRGLALIFIFWDHVPANPLAELTLRNFGFSDAAELFVFLAGYVSIVVYGKIARRDGYFVACMRILRRTWVLYVAHIFLLSLLMGIVFVANNHVETRDMVREMGLEYFVGNPQQALADELLLRFKPNLTDPLPLYILLLALLPVMLPLMLRRLGWSIALSIGVYLTVPLLDWNLPDYEGKQWIFNPFAWQAVFVFGGVCALLSERARQQPPVQRVALWKQPLFMLCALYVAFAGLATFTGKWPTVRDAWMPQAIADAIYPMSKNNLSPLRLLHFLALVYVVGRLLPPASTWMDNWPARQLMCMGRNSLEVFCLGILLAPLADMVNALADDAWHMRVTTALLGAALLLLLGNWLELNKRLDNRKRPSVQEPPRKAAQAL